MGELDEELARWRLREGVVDARLDGQTNVVEVEHGRLAGVVGVDGGVFEHLAHVAVHELEQLRDDPALDLVDSHRFEDLRDDLGIVGQIARLDHLVHELAVMLGVMRMAIRMRRRAPSLGGCRPS